MKNVYSGDDGGKDGYCGGKFLLPHFGQKNKFLLTLMLRKINFSYPHVRNSLHTKITQRFLCGKISNKFRFVLSGSFGIRLAKLKDTLK
jgi:hypothetical protein